MELPGDTYDGAITWHEEGGVGRATLQWDDSHPDEVIDLADPITADTDAHAVAAMFGYELNNISLGHSTIFIEVDRKKRATITDRGKRVIADRTPTAPQAEPAKLTDTELLNFLESTKRGYGCGWVLRDSNHGQGMRLHETTYQGHDAQPTAREAIAVFIAKEGHA